MLSKTEIETYSYHTKIIFPKLLFSSLEFECDVSCVVNKTTCSTTCIEESTNTCYQLKGAFIGPSEKNPDPHAGILKCHTNFYNNFFNGFVPNISKRQNEGQTDITPVVDNLNLGKETFRYWQHYHYSWIAFQLGPKFRPPARIRAYGVNGNTLRFYLTDALPPANVLPPLPANHVHRIPTPTLSPEDFYEFYFDNTTATNET